MLGVEVKTERMRTNEPIELYKNNMKRCFNRNFGVFSLVLTETNSKIETSVPLVSRYNLEIVYRRTIWASHVAWPFTNIWIFWGIFGSFQTLRTLGIFKNIHMFFGWALCFRRFFETVLSFVPEATKFSDFQLDKCNKCK